MHPLLTQQHALHHQDDVAREAIAARGARAPSNPVPFRLHALAPADRRHVEAGFDRLSEATVRARFLGPVKATPRLFDWVDELNGWDQIAVAASHAESGAPLGLARFVRDKHDPTRADVAVTVVDGWQRRGVGTALMRKLARRAAAVGITTFTATAFAENQGARALARKLGRTRIGPVSWGVMSLDIRIRDARRGSTPQWPRGMIALSPARRQRRSA